MEPKIMWICVRFSNGDAFRLAAKVMARKIATDYSLGFDTRKKREEAYKEMYEETIRKPDELIKFAEEEMQWHEVSLNAIAYEPREQVDYAKEWAKAPKTYQIEIITPEIKQQKTDIITAREEDAREEGHAIPDNVERPASDKKEALRGMPEHIRERDMPKKGQAKVEREEPTEEDIPDGPIDQVEDL